MHPDPPGEGCTGLPLPGQGINGEKKKLTGEKVFNKESNLCIFMQSYRIQGAYMDRQDLKAAADLAMLDLTEEELELLVGEFAQMLEYMSVMDGADTSDQEVTTHILAGETVLREDEAISDARQRSLLLKQSRETSGSAIHIPRVLP